MNTEEIKNRYTMTDILTRYGLKKGRNGLVRCPFHDDHHASLKVYDRSFYCFSCHTGGDVIRFVELFEGVDFREACKRLGGQDEPLTADVRARIERQKAEAARKEAEKDAAVEEFQTATAILRDLEELRDRHEPDSEMWAAATHEIVKLEAECDAKLDAALALMKKNGEEDPEREATA